MPKINANAADVVEALSSPTYARLLAALLQEAADALRITYTGTEPNGSAMTPSQELGIDAIRSLGAQLVTATTTTDGAK